MDARQLISGLLHAYYRNATAIAPDQIEKREFAFGTFDAKIAARHLSFADEEQLRKYLVENVPLHVSYSQAYYERPAERPMENKGWLGAELIFDLDATELRLPCQAVHGTEWVCSNCFASVKEEALKLIEDFLIPDFGFSEKDLEINFSGNRGYHVHIKRKELLELDSEARREITSYIAGANLDFSELFPTVGQRGKMLRGPTPDTPGWGGKIARSFIGKLEKGPEALMAVGIDARLARMLYKKRALIEMGIKNGNWDMVYIRNKAEFWSNIINREKIAISDAIDRNVTTDTSHLIRLPNSIHGGTGLIAKRIASIHDLERFEPMKDAIAFREGSLKVRISKADAFTMNGETFGPYDNAEAVLPEYAAVYLYLKGRAAIVDSV
ncbi:MAG: DNA primase catalytic subunit PriS [Candidatus Micrarchaeaceae archaeon]